MASLVILLTARTARIACSDRHTYRQTHTHTRDNYCNPCCASTPRVNDVPSVTQETSDHLLCVCAVISVCLCPVGDVTIAGGMTFTVISDLSGGSHQFTLTSISIGGPATTVTWTRDSETVLGGMTVFNNAVTAQYTHTLTVTGRLGGQYQCTVTNRKPSSGTVQLTVQGDVT